MTILWLNTVSSQDEICSDIKNDLTLVKINVITLNFGSDTCQIKVGIVQVNTKSAQKMSDVRLLFHVLYVPVMCVHICCLCTCVYIVHLCVSECV